jgi:hypothetical protein
LLVAQTSAEPGQLFEGCALAGGRVIEAVDQPTVKAVGAGIDEAGSVGNSVEVLFDDR